jgi:hypothetical protein
MRPLFVAMAGRCYVPLNLGSSGAVYLGIK